MLRFNLKNKEKIWFSSDFHLGHQREFVWESRGFSSPQDHTENVIRITNECVGEDDVLFFLGDFCLNSSVEDFEDYIDRINCKKIYMLWGNHNNPVMRVYKNLIYDKFGLTDCVVYPFKYKNIIFMGDYLEISVNRQHMILMHYPIDSWNGMRDGAYMICGHCHYSYPNIRHDANNGKILDVGWDGIGRPYEFSEIVDTMEYKNLKVIDHHVL